MSEFSMTIDGGQAATETTFPVTNPATGEVMAEAPESSRAQVDEAMNASARAFESWQHDRPLRQKALKDLASAVEANLEELAEVITMEEGKPLGESVARYGPIVMNTRAELERAFEDLREGRF